jgi:hypothetical protein
MGRKPKAGGAPGKTTNPEQSARFIEAARQAGVDETGEAFERAFRQVIRHKPQAGSSRSAEPARSAGLKRAAPKKRD